MMVTRILRLCRMDHGVLEVLPIIRLYPLKPPLCPKVSTLYHQFAALFIPLSGILSAYC